MLFLLNLLTIALSFFVPKKKNRWVFASWFGDKISDNPKALYDYIVKTHPEIETAWIVNEPDKFVDSGCNLIKKGSIRSIIYQASSKVAVFSGGYMDLGRFNFLGRVCKVQLWHGVPWKHIGLDMPIWHRNWKQKVGQRLYSLITHYDLYLATSPEYEKILQTAVGKKLKIIKAGYPRNSLFYDKEKLKLAKDEVLKRLNLDSNKKIISYLPTFRDGSEDTFDFSLHSTDSALMQCLEENDAIIVQKSHFANQAWKSKMQDSGTSRIITFNEIDCQVLLAASDILITDYSGAYFDYLVLGRPVIHFLYDYEKYISEDRGLYFEKEYVVGGSEAETYDQLIDEIKKNLSSPEENKERLELMRKRFMTYENENSCELIYNAIIKCD